MSAALLEVAGLDVRFATPDGPVHAVRNLTFNVAPGETLGIVGESGSGKSQTVLALLGLLSGNGQASGSGRFQGQELLGMREADLNLIRGARIAMVFQDPMSSLNPYVTIGRQMSHVLVQHRRLRRREALIECREMLEAAHIPEAARRLRMYPHELSGGMRQRVMIAAALLCRPALLIADEPTTALDVTVQAQILQLMRELKGRFGTAIILITHDLGVVAGSADRVLVMQDGEWREEGSTDQVLCEPRHAYTKALVAAVPRLDLAPSPPPAAVLGPPISAGALLVADALQVKFELNEGWFAPTAELRAVDGVSFSVERGETLAVVGESGCGKSTLGRAVLQLVQLSSGRVTFLGRSLAGLPRAEMNALRRDLQVVFQDPFASLNPRMTARDIVAEPLETFAPEQTHAERTREVVAMLERVGLEAAHLSRYPHQFSGGQCQRIAIARALITRPKLLVCDEALSALDVTVQAQILDLLVKLRDEIGMSLIFIAHDLAVVRRISQRVMVMYLGRVMEFAASEEIYMRPRHPYTRALIAAAPSPDPRRERARVTVPVPGDLPSPLDPPSGCVFRTRCLHAVARCAAEVPGLEGLGASMVACHRARELADS